MDPRDDPSTKSEDFKKMEPSWHLVQDIIDGHDAVKKQRTKYLPQWTRESLTAYETRLLAAPWRPEFADALRNLCSKPFTKEVVVNPDAPDSIQGKPVTVEGEVTKKREGGIVDDIDGVGNSLHVFARETFVNAVAFGLDAIYVTYPIVDPKVIRTRADEKRSGARPYWVHIRACCILALHTKQIDGRTVVSEIRFMECETIPDGFEEKEIERIRVLKLDAMNLPTWQTFIKDSKGDWISENVPQRLEGVTEIPIALLFTGERSGCYCVKMPLIDLAHMQMELYRTLSRKDQILTLAGSPMLQGKGMRPPPPTPQTMPNGMVVDVPASQVEVGPGVVLFAPPAQDGVQSEWNYVQPAAANIQEVREDVNDVMDDFRRLAMQPNTPKSGNMVATAAAIDASKAHSAVEVWANALADALNQALKYTTEWMKIGDTVTAVVHTDFGVDVQGADEMRVLGDMQKRGVISKQTEREEAARRGVLGPQFDEDEEEERIAEEQQGLEPDQPIDPRTGLPLPQPPGGGGTMPPLQPRVIQGGRGGAQTT